MRKPDVEKLIAARALIARPGGWTQGAYARNATGNEIGYADDEACSFCVSGAMRKVGVRVCVDLEMWNLLRPLMSNHITQWNDVSERKQTDVIAAFDRAIELARAS